MRKMNILMSAFLIAALMNGCAKEEVKEDLPVVEEELTDEEKETLYWEEMIEKIQSSNTDLEIQLNEKYETMPTSVLKAIQEKEIAVTFKTNDHQFVVTKDCMPNMNENVAGTTLDALISFYQELDENKEEAPQEPTPEAPQETPQEPVEPSTPEVPQEPTPEEPQAPVSSKVNEIIEAIYASQELPGYMELDEEMLKSVYGLSSNEVSQFIVRTPVMMVQATEFAVFEVKEGMMETVKTGVQNRIAALEEQWKTYLPAQLELVQNAKTYENGNYYIMIISENAEDLLNLVASLF